MCFVLSIAFLLCLIRENFHGLRPQWFLFYFPQWIFTMSPQKEFSRISPPMASFLFPQRIYTVSLREGTTNFAFNGFIFISSKDFHRLLPLVVFYFYPYWFSFYFSIPNSFVLPRTLFYFIVVMCDCVDS